MRASTASPAAASERLKDHLEGRSDTFVCEYRLRRRDGSWCWNFDRGRVVARDPQFGALLRMVGTACDVSQRKAEEARAMEALERFALAQSNAGAGTWDLDLESFRLQLCPRSREVHGLSPNGPVFMASTGVKSTGSAVRIPPASRSTKIGLGEPSARSEL